MTPAPTNHTSQWMAPRSAQTMHQRALAVGIIFGAISLGLAFFPDTRAHFFQTYLVAFVFWLGISLGSMAFLMIQHLTGGKWGMVICRPLEAATNVLPLMVLLVIPIFFGMKHLYVWTNPVEVAKSKHLQLITQQYLTVGGTAHYLFLNGFIGRAILYFIIWLLFAGALTRLSKVQDSPPMQNLSPRFRKIAAPGLIVYAFTITFALVDWVMSLDPNWVSTIFGFIMIAGECLSAMCFMIVIETLFSREEPLTRFLKPKEVHDHGKLVLTFIMLWAYFSFSQWLIIWAGNLPPEIRFYLPRVNHAWGGVALFLVIFHFAVPFALLLSRPFKRNPHSIVWLAGWMMLMRVLDLFWYVEPTFNRNLNFQWGYLQYLAVLPAIGGLWLAYFFRNLQSRPMLPAYDLHAQEFLDYVGVVHD